MKNHENVEFLFDKRKMSPEFLKSLKNLKYTKYNFTLPVENIYVPTQFDMVVSEDENKILRFKEAN